MARELFNVTRWQQDQAVHLKGAAPDLFERVYRGDLSLNQAGRVLRERQGEASRYTLCRECPKCHAVEPANAFRIVRSPHADRHMAPQGAAP